MAQRACVIIGARPVGPFMVRAIPDGALLIAADAGWQTAERLGLVPDVVVGDFDSSPPPFWANELVQLPAEKDDTDMMAAARLALAKGCDEVLLLGALGGREDHTLANMQVLLFLARQGVGAAMAGERCHIRCIGPGTLRLPAVARRSLSVLAAGGPAEGVTLRGLKYPLSGARLTPDYPVGVSNEFAGEWAEITHTDGYLYVITAEESDEARHGADGNIYGG